MGGIVDGACEDFGSHDMPAFFKIDDAGGKRRDRVCNDTLERIAVQYAMLPSVQQHVFNAGPGPNDRRVSDSESFVVNNTLLYRYDKTTGALELSMSAEGLESITMPNSAIPSQGISARLCMWPYGIMRFENVKSFKPVTRDDGTYFFDAPEKPATAPKLSLYQRVMHRIGSVAKNHGWF